MTRPSHPPWLDHPNNVWWSMDVMKLLAVQSSPASCCHFPSYVQISSAPCSQTCGWQQVVHEFKENFRAWNVIRPNIRGHCPLTMSKLNHIKH
jgi:hypothetical protein